MANAENVGTENTRQKMWHYFAGMHGILNFSIFSKKYAAQNQKYNTLSTQECYHTTIHCVN